MGICVKNVFIRMGICVIFTKSILPVWWGTYMMRYPQILAAMLRGMYYQAQEKAHVPDRYVICCRIFSDKLEANLGYVYENVVAQMLVAKGNNLFYYTMVNSGVVYAKNTLFIRKIIRGIMVLVISRYTWYRFYKRL